MFDFIREIERKSPCDITIEDIRKLKANGFFQIANYIRIRHHRYMKEEREKLKKELRKEYLNKRKKCLTMFGLCICCEREQPEYKKSFCTNCRLKKNKWMREHNKIIRKKNKKLK